MALPSIFQCFKQLTLQTGKVAVNIAFTQIRTLRPKEVTIWQHKTFEGPFPPGKYRKIFFPEKYTTEPLRVIKTGGRDAITGRVVFKRIGGGISHSYFWVEWKRTGPTDGSFKEERVMLIKDDFCRTSKLALVAGQEGKRYYLATENMKVGDILRTSCFIPRLAVKANEGDAFPLGALPIGSLVHCVERYPNDGGRLIKAAGTCGEVLSKVDGKVIVRLPSKREVCVSQECMATVGRVSNVNHRFEHIGTPGNNRRLGRRPRSGWWQRKDGYCGRKIRPLPPMKTYISKPPPPPSVLKLNF